MNDDEILKTVEAVLGKGVQIVDCEKTSTIQEEEILLINGIPVTLQSTEASAIKKALSNQEIPSADLLNALLFKAGILSKSVCLETSLSVKSTLTKTEEITVARDGQVLDERCYETKEDNFYTSSSSEIWKPTGMPRAEMAARLKEQVDAAANGLYILTPPPDGGSTSTISPNKVPVIPVPSNRHHISRFPTESSNGSVGSYSSSSDNSSTTSSRPVSNVSIIDSNTATNCTVTFPDDDDDHVYDNVPISQMPKPPSRAKQQTSNSWDSGHPACTGDYEDLSSHMSRLQTTASISSSFGDYSTASGASTVDDVDFVHVGGVSAGVKKIPSTTSPVFMLGRPQTHLPTIFGTVASDQCPKDNSSRRSLPQVSSGAASGAKLSASDAAILDSNESHPKLSNRQKDAPELLDDNALVYRDGNLISGSLDALIQHMCPTNTYYPDRAYLFAFLLSARLFIKPHALLAQICDLCHQQQQLHSISQETPHLQRFTTHFVQLLAEWIDTFPYDFRDERVMKHVRSVTQKCIQITPGLRKEVSTLLQNLLQRLQALERYEEFLEKINAYDTDFLPSTGGGGSSSSIISGAHNSTSTATISHSMSTNSSNNSHSNLHSNQNHPSVTISATLATPDITDLCPSSQSLAYQLTHIELERLSYIGPEEFVQAFAKENPSLENTFKDMKKTRNLESYVQWFNRLSYFVATEIVKHSKKKQRVRVVEYWIETARESFNIGNFNSLMAIIAGLNMSPISRLKKTWAKIQSAKFSILEHQMDPSSNFSSYRSTLKAAMWRSAGATDERERIVIPFFSLLVKDLYFLNEGCSNKLPNGHINFEKFWQLAKQVTEFIAWKQVSCPYDRNDKIIMFLQTNSILNETTLAWASFECEQPMNHERDRYKSLKQEAQLMNSSTSLGGGSSCG